MMIRHRQHLPVFRLLILAALLAFVLALALAWRSAAGQDAPGSGGWTRMTFGVGASAVEPDQDGRLYAGTYYEGLFVTSDGAAWDNPLPAPIACLLRGGSAVYVGTWGSGVMKSTDGGSHWSAVNTGLQANDVYALVLDASASNILYAGTEAGVFKSTNAGVSWIAAGGLGNRIVYALAFLGNSLYAGTDNGVYVSTDGGAHWSGANQGLGSGRVISLAGGGGKLYAGTDGTVQSRSASGVWFSPPIGSPPGPVTTLVVDPADGNRVAAGTAGGVYISENGGLTWRAHNGGLSGYGLEVAALALDSAAQPPVLYAATSAGVWRTEVVAPDLEGDYLPLILR